MKIGKEGNDRNKEKKLNAKVKNLGFIYRKLSHWKCLIGKVLLKEDTLKLIFKKDFIFKV